MTKYPCGRCKVEGDLPSHQWVMYGWVDESLDLTLAGVRQGNVTRTELDESCWASYRSGVTRIIQAQRHQNSGEVLPLRPWARAVKDGQDGKTYALTEGNYDRLKAWTGNKANKPLQPEGATEAA